MVYLPIALVTAGVFLLLIVLSRANERFCLSVRGGRSVVVRGYLPAGLEATLRGALVEPDADVLVKVYQRGEALSVTLNGGSDEDFRRVQAVLAPLMPEQLDPPQGYRTPWERWLGVVGVAWWVDDRRPKDGKIIKFRK